MPPTNQNMIHNAQLWSQKMGSKESATQHHIERKASLTWRPNAGDVGRPLKTAILSTNYVLQPMPKCVVSRKEAPKGKPTFFLVAAGSSTPQRSKQQRPKFYHLAQNSDQFENLHWTLAFDNLHICKATVMFPFVGVTTFIGRDDFHRQLSRRSIYNSTVLVFSSWQIWKWSIFILGFQ